MKPLEPRTVKPMDPTLRAAAKLDRILVEMTPAMRAWAIAWLNAKYGPHQEGGKS